MKDIQQMKEAIDNIEYRTAADALLRKCGLYANLSGYKYIIDAVVLYSTQSCDRIGDVYDAIAVLRGHSSKTIMRCINYSIHKVKELPQRLSELAGITVPEDAMRNGFVIANLGRIMPCFSEHSM